MERLTCTVVASPSSHVFLHSLARFVVPCNGHITSCGEVVRERVENIPVSAASLGLCCHALCRHCHRHHGMVIAVQGREKVRKNKNKKDGGRHTLLAHFLAFKGVCTWVLSGVDTGLVVVKAERSEK